MNKTLMYLGAAAVVIAVGGVVYKYAFNQRNRMERTFAMI
jgi:hypothetical protein